MRGQEARRGQDANGGQVRRRNRGAVSEGASDGR